MKPLMKIPPESWYTLRERTPLFFLQFWWSQWNFDLTLWIETVKETITDGEKKKQLEFSGAENELWIRIFESSMKGLMKMSCWKRIHWGNKAHVLFVYYRYRQCLFHSCTSGLFWWRMMLQIRIRKLIMLATIIMKDIRMVTRICKMFRRLVTDTDWN